MKIALYKGTRKGLQGIYSRLVRLVDRGIYSHCEVVFSDGLSASSSAIDGGVRFKMIEYDDLRWDFIEIPDSFEAAARDWFTRHDGKFYDYIGVTRFVLWFVPDGENRYFCSEAIAAALGLHDPWRYGPNALHAVLKIIEVKNDTTR